MQQIADWLKKLGMAEYAEHFGEERIDIDVLPELTDQDLENTLFAHGVHRVNLANPASRLASSTAALSP